MICDPALAVDDLQGAARHVDPQRLWCIRQPAAQSLMFLKVHSSNETRQVGNVLPCARLMHDQAAVLEARTAFRKVVDAAIYVAISVVIVIPSAADQHVPAHDASIRALLCRDARSQYSGRGQRVNCERVILRPYLRNFRHMDSALWT